MARCGICNGISENNTDLPDPYELILYGRAVMGTWCDRCVAEQTTIAEEFAEKLHSSNGESSKSQESAPPSQSPLAEHLT